MRFFCNDSRRIAFSLTVNLGRLPVLIITFASLCIAGCDREGRSQEECAVKNTTEMEPTSLPLKGTRIRLNGVRFMLSNSVYADMEYLDGELLAMQADGPVDFDHPESFSLNAKQALIGVQDSVLQDLFNDKVFHYADSPLKNLKIRFIRHEESGQPVVYLHGDVFLKPLWLPFRQEGTLKLDKESNTLVMQMQSIHILESIPTMEVMKLVQLKLEGLVKLSADRGIVIRGNDIIIHPFELFPPPRISGRIEGVQIDPERHRMLITLKGQQGNASEKEEPRGSVRITGGTLRFSRMFMVQADLQLLDADPSDTFVFNLPAYIKHVNHGHVEIMKNGAVKAVLPDYDDLNP